MKRRKPGSIDHRLVHFQLDGRNSLDLTSGKRGDGAAEEQSNY